MLNNIVCVPSKVQSSHQEALLYVFEDNEAVIKMIMKGRSPTMRHVFRTHRVVLDWLFDRIILDPRIQIKYIDTEKHFADILTKGNFTRDEWNHLLQDDLIKGQIYLKPPITIIMSNSWKASLQQATQSGMMTVLGLLKSGKTDIETYERSERPDQISWRLTREVRLGFFMRKVFMMEPCNQCDRPGRLVANSQNFVMGNDEAELELSVDSRSFVNRMSDQVRKIQKISNVTKNCEKTFYHLVNVYDCKNGISSLHWKELLAQLSIHRKHDKFHT